MSDAGREAPVDEPATPMDKSRGATRDAISKIEGAADLPTIERVTAEQDAALQFAREQAEAMEQGLRAAHMRSACDSVSAAASNYNKTDLKDLVEEKLEELADESDGRRPLDLIFHEDLEEVVIVRTTDARQETVYRWQFERGTVETWATKDGRSHLQWSMFRDEYFDATGEDPKKPTEECRGGEEWREFVVDIVQERGREVTTRGPRTTAVDALKNFVRRSRAFAAIEDMVDYDGVRMDAAPDENPEEIWIHNHDIKRICDDVELNSVIELQNELDGRGYTVGRVNGVSESTFVDGNKVTYWVVDASLSNPATFEADPDSPAEQVAELEEEDEDADDEDDWEPGAIGVVGEDPDGGDSA